MHFPHTVKSPGFKLASLMLLGLILAMLLTACETVSTGSSTTSAKPSHSLKVGIMPAVDSAPILLADQKGYFSALGLDVEVQIYTNAMNRQSALQSGELDGAMTDVIALVNNVGFFHREDLHQRDTGQAGDDQPGQAGSGGYP